MTLGRSQIVVHFLLSSIFSPSFLSGAYWAERQPYMTINADKKTDQVFRYEMKVPYESWMAGATLVLRMVQTSPGGVRRVFTVDVNGAVDVSRK